MNGDLSGAAVMPDFPEAVGLDGLLAGKGLPGRPPAGATAELPSPAAPTAPSWPPPPTPEPFKAIVTQLDTLLSMLGRVERVEQKFTDQVADSVWPLAYYYGAGSNERPSPVMLWLMGGLSVLAFAVVKVQQVRAARAAAAADGADRKEP
jgi:hypothetical protein